MAGSGWFSRRMACGWLAAVWMVLLLAMAWAPFPGRVLAGMQRGEPSPSGTSIHQQPWDGVTLQRGTEGPVLSMKKGSVINFQFEEPAALQASEEIAEIASREAFAENSSFPGVYTVHYSYNACEGDGAHDWLRHVDMIRIECDHDHGASDEKCPPGKGNGEAERASLANEAFLWRSCRGHVLVRSSDDYEEVFGRLTRFTTPIKAEDEEETSSKSKKQLFPALPSLDFNATLTEAWVHPRMQVAQAAAETRRLAVTANTETGSSKHNHLRQSAATKNDKETRNLFVPRRDYSTIYYPYECYLDYFGTLEWIRDFVAHYENSEVLDVSWTDIGDSWLKTQGNADGHDIYALTITLKPTRVGSRMSPSFSEFFNAPPNSRSIDNTNEKAPFLITSSTHAREYTPPELVRRWLERLVQHVEARDPYYLAMLEHTTIHWIPYVNPDARVLAETSQPMRRKNVNDQWTRNPNDSKTCLEDSYGVDLNRNCPFEWGENDGSSDKACSQFGRGSGPGSEPEIQALERYALEIFPAEQRANNALSAAAGGDYWIAHDRYRSVEVSSTKWKGYDAQSTTGVFVDVHSYGRVYIYPWGNTNSLCPNDAAFRSAMGHIESMTRLDALGPGPDHYGVASGATDDWGYGVLGAFSMTWELGSDFHEPCDEFEDHYEKHFGAFEYLTAIAPFPYALGQGPILREIRNVPRMLAMHYLPVVGDLDSNSTTIRYEKKSFAVGDDQEVVRLQTNTEFDVGETLSLSVVARFPERISRQLDPIEFDDEDFAQEYLKGYEEASWIAKIRVFYGDNGNPLVGARFANRTFADDFAASDYWEFDVSDQEPSSASEDDDAMVYEISPSIYQLWEAFGRNRVDDVTESHTLYFQAMDNLGNIGPLGASIMEVFVRKETESDDDDDGIDMEPQFVVPPPARPVIDWDSGSSQEAKSAAVTTVHQEKKSSTGSFVWDAPSEPTTPVFSERTPPQSPKFGERSSETPEFSYVATNGQDTVPTLEASGCGRSGFRSSALVLSAMVVFLSIIL